MRTSIKLGYGIGQIGTGVKNTAFSIFCFSITTRFSAYLEAWRAPLRY